MKALLIESPFGRFIGSIYEWFSMGLVSHTTYLKMERPAIRVV